MRFPIQEVDSMTADSDIKVVKQPANAVSKKRFRRDEAPRTWFRSERVYLLSDNNWYFRTREGVEIGPYDSKFEAEIEAGLLGELIKNSQLSEEKLDVIREFVLDAFAMGQSLTPIFEEENVAKKPA